MAADNTYTPIQTYTVPSAQASYTFSSIPGTYTDLVLVCNPSSTLGNSQVAVTVNGDTATNYSRTTLFGNGSTAQSSRGTSVASFPLTITTDPSTAPSTLKANFMNYSNTTTYKLILQRGDSQAVYVTSDVSLWRSTAAITSITLTANTYNFGIGSTFTLYGITAA